MITITATACGASKNEAVETTLDVSLQDYRIVPNALSAKAGAVTFTVHNDGQSPHDFVIRDQNVRTKKLDPGQRESVTTSLKAGTYTFICSIPGHESLGMTGTLTIA